MTDKYIDEVCQKFEEKFNVDKPHFPNGEPAWAYLHTKDLEEYPSAVEIEDFLRLALKNAMEEGRREMLKKVEKLKVNTDDTGYDGRMFNNGIDAALAAIANIKE